MDLIAIQHVLPSLTILADALPRGAWDRVQVAGKRYSTIPRAARGRLASHGWTVRPTADDLTFDYGPASCIALDEGGLLRDRAPAGLIAAGVEQTSSGAWGPLRWPTVLVCRSAAKLLFESQIIARGILRKLDHEGLLDGRRVGVIGLGALGGEVARTLAERGVPTLGYDVKPSRSTPVATCADAGELVARCDVVLGATGRDCLRGVEVPDGTAAKAFASCSSSNIEFRSLLRGDPARGGWGPCTVQVGQASWTVLNAGYPVNFDRQREWERPEEIWLTRMLCARGLDQARSLAGARPHGAMLSPAVQHRLVNEWLDRLPAGDGVRTLPNLSERFFTMHSEGKHSMASKNSYSLHETTPGALALMRSHDQPYDVEVLGVPIRVLPGVWSPAYDWSSLFYVENLSAMEGLRVLEIGCGTGVIAAFAARAGASEVVATDVNPAAVENARQNFERLGLSQATAIASDLFENVPGRFDVVAWNAPYHGSAPADTLERGCADEGYADIRRFFEQVDDHLAPAGTVEFGFSESGDLPLIRKLIAGAGLKVRRELSDWRQGYNCMLMELERTDAE